MSMLENALAQVDELRAALERERERSTAYAAELELCGKELERRQHHIKKLEAQTQWEPVEDGYTYTDKRDHTLSVYPHSLDIADEHTAVGISVQLPGDVHLCRRVDAANDAAEAEPLPCPRCRQDAVVFEADDGWLVECNSASNCSRGVGGYESRAAAVSAWNCRTAAEVTP